MSPGPTTTTAATTAAEFAHLVTLLRDACARFEPAAVDVVDVDAVFDSLVAGQRLIGGAVTRFTARYAQSSGWRRSGARSVEDDIGAKTGTTVVRARRQLLTSRRLDSQPATNDALRSGAVSGEQAVEVSDAVEAAPLSETELLQSARGEPFHQLRKRAAAAKAAADVDREATRRRLQAQRSMRRWNDADGMGNLLLKLPADEMAEIDASLKASTDQVFLEARRSGLVEPAEAYAADAIVARLLGTEPAATTGRTGSVARADNRASHANGVPADHRASQANGVPADAAGGADAPAGSSGDDPSRSGSDGPPGRAGSDGSSRERRSSQAVRPDKKVIAVIDVASLNRGSVEGDEQCEIAGVGPVSVTAVRRLLSDAFLAIVIKDGVDIRNVTHLGRQVTAHQRTALESRGGACEFCGSTFRVEIDHIEGWALTHTTHVDDLSHKCWHCHDQKTRFGLTETGPPGNRTLLNSDGTPFRNQDRNPDRKQEPERTAHAS